MFYHCPGQDSRKVRPENIVCAYCGHLTEIFSDEITVVCPRCENSIYQERLPTCLDWCQAARQCLGEARYKQYKESR